MLVVVVEQGVKEGRHSPKVMLGEIDAFLRTINKPYQRYFVR